MCQNGLKVTGKLLRRMKYNIYKQFLQIHTNIMKTSIKLQSKLEKNKIYGKCKSQLKQLEMQNYKYFTVYVLVVFYVYILPCLFSQKNYIIVILKKYERRNLTFFQPFAYNQSSWPLGNRGVARKVL